MWGFMIQSEALTLSTLSEKYSEAHCDTMPPVQASVPDHDRFRINLVLTKHEFISVMTQGCPHSTQTWTEGYCGPRDYSFSDVTGNNRI